MKKLNKERYQYILIIGNGFDLDLSLPTRYSDFIKSPYFNRLRNQENDLAIYLKGVNDLNKWVDIEEELKNYSNITKHPQKYLSDYKELCRSLLEYIGSIKYDDIDKESTAYRMIKNILKAQNILILDFNYTDSLHLIIKEIEKEEINEKKNVEHIKLHGSISDGDIIFGVEDNAKIKKEHIFLKKSTNVMFNPVDFSSVINKCDSLVVFGHSLGATDHMYFDDFFMKAIVKSVKPRIGRSQQEIALFYKGENSYYDLLAEIDTLTHKNLKKLKQINEFKMIEVNEKG